MCLCWKYWGMNQDRKRLNYCMSVQVTGILCVYFHCQGFAFFHFSWPTQHPWWPPSVPASCTCGGAGALPCIWRDRNVTSKCEYHQTSPCRLFLTFPSLPFRALAAVVVVVCNTQLILFLFQLAILGRPGLPTFFFSLPEKKVQSQRGKKGWEKDSAWQLSPAWMFSWDRCRRWSPPCFN